MKSKELKKFANLKFSSHSIEVDQLILSVLDSIEFFKTQKDSSQLSNGLQQFNLHLEKLSKIANTLENAARECDYDINSPGNGYWSYIHSFNCAIKIMQNTFKQMTKNREKILFNKKFYIKELDLWNQIFESLIEICETLLQLREGGDKTVLFSQDNNWVILNRLHSTIHQKAFYGSALGFQCAKSVKPLVNFLASTLVSYSKWHYSDKHKSIKLLDFPLSTASNKGDVDFCKSFWFMSESPAMHTLPNALSDSMDINKIFKIPAEPLKVFSEKFQQHIDIPLPHSHIGIQPVSCRLLCARKREGMLGKKSSSKSLPRSRNLLFHVHGGGWAAQTSKSHEVYLRQWASYLDCPILSIDYQLAPKAPFPRGLEDIYYAYCWALNNFEYLGTTGEKIVFAGDSAGANLNSALMIKCIENGVRIPDGLLNIYGIYHVDFLIAPSVCLSLTDPMLPFGLTSNLIKCYGIDKNVINTDINMNIIGEKDIFKFHDSYLLSPYKAPEEILKQFPPTRFLSSILDPLLDDNIEFGKKLRNLGVNTNVDILQGLYHGFLYFIKISKDCRDGSLMCAARIKELFEMQQQQQH
ncbi:hypothetical protein PVAND_004585 [Polypedilum vanderplanki]|uniref:Hormone-sensitive lipase n=1 Tax=Polypedilum vanderplanki TaxID=319348 RepID=A0A9J6BXN2_POLVA|nr:hypothetical protein PVAND_004585 [Polypedilum vanderplanki]